MTKFEIFTPKSDDHKVYRLVVQQLESDLILGSGFSEVHLGMSMNLEEIISTMEGLQYQIVGVHNSCVSNTFVVPSTNTPLGIHCLMFTKENDTLRYHVACAFRKPRYLEDTRENISSFYMEKFASKLTWGNKSGTTYYVTSRAIMV